MKKQLINQTSDESPKNKDHNLQFVISSFTLLAINFGLMLFVGMYWLHPTFHTFITGKPL